MSQQNEKRQNDEPATLSPLWVKTKQASKPNKQTQQAASMTETSSSPGPIISSLPTHLLLVLFVTPLLWNGQWYAAGAVAVIILLHDCSRQAHASLNAAEKCKIRFNVIQAADVVQALSDLESSSSPSTDDAVVLSAGLAALAKKYNAIRHKTLDNDDNTDDDMAKQSTKLSKHESKQQQQSNLQVDALALLCQEAAYVGFRYLVDINPPSSNTEKLQNDNLVQTTMNVSAASIALLALIAKNECVRERHLYQADIYGLDLPMQIIRQALEMAKDIQQQDDESERDCEQEAAEVQRKSCLLLGALAEGNAQLAQLVAGENGIQVILNAAQWYRHHAEVANWALWALFILCFEYPANKVTFVDADGVPLVIELMRNCPLSTEVARHGVALIFDLLRENSNRLVDVWRIRQAALTAGLHAVLVQAMQHHDDAMDIMMMGSEILVGTGFEGEIPAFVPPEMNTIER